MLVVLAGWALGSLVGALLAASIARNTPLEHALILRQPPRPRRHRQQPHAPSARLVLAADAGRVLAGGVAGGAGGGAEGRAATT